MSLVHIQIGGNNLVGRLEVDAAPRTTGKFMALLPYLGQLIHCRWSGEGCWMPFGEHTFDFPYENHTSHPAPGQFIFYPGGYSEAEILLAYGGVSFSSKLGQLAGNHFLTIVEGMQLLPAIGRRSLWEGAQSIAISLV